MMIYECRSNSSKTLVLKAYCIVSKFSASRTEILMVFFSTLKPSFLTIPYHNLAPHNISIFHTQKYISYTMIVLILETIDMVTNVTTCTVQHCMDPKETVSNHIQYYAITNVNR